MKAQKNLSPCEIKINFKQYLVTESDRYLTQKEKNWVLESLEERGLSKYFSYIKIAPEAYAIKFTGHVKNYNQLQGARSIISGYDLKIYKKNGTYKELKERYENKILATN